MEGDYFRYLTEFEREEAVKADYIFKADKCYKKALEKAKHYMKATNQLRLGVSLNYSVFLFEIKNQTQEAVDVSREAFNQAISELDNLCEFFK